MDKIFEELVGRKRRTNDLTLSYWDELRGDRAYPTPDDVTEAAQVSEDLNLDVFMVYFNGQPSESVFTFGSKVLDTICHAETTGARMVDCLPAHLQGSMLSFVRTISKARKPIAVSSSFDADDGAVMLYRSIYLPLSADQRKVDYLLGAFSYKEQLAA